MSSIRIWQMGNAPAMRSVRRALLLLLLVIAIGFPLVFSNPAIITIAVSALLLAVAASGWNIFSGYTGYIALGHAVYYGIGAYVFALVTHSMQTVVGPLAYLIFLLVPVTGLIAAVFAVPFGWIALRTRKHAFVVITIASFFIMQLMAYNLRPITNGTAGLNPPNPVDWGGDFFNIPFYYAALVLLLFALATSWWVRHSKYGLGLLAIRDDEDRALGLGVKTGSAKLVAFVISAFFVGMVGALHAYFNSFVYPSFAFDALFDVLVALICFLGGVGTLSGPVLGAFILVPVQQYITLQFSDPGVYLIIIGVIFLAVMLLLPEGVVPTSRKLWRQWRIRHVKSAPGVDIANPEDQSETVLAETPGGKENGS